MIDFKHGHWWPGFKGPAGKKLKALLYNAVIEGYTHVYILELSEDTQTIELHGVRQ